MAGYIGKAQSQALLNVETDKITEGDSSVEIIDDGSGNILFTTDASEAARIDASGNLLVGKTSADGGGNDGLEVRSNGIAFLTRDGGTVVELNRKTSDGKIIDFRKDGSIVGSIGANSSQVYIAGTGAGLKCGTANLRPTNGSGSTSDNSVNLGSGSFRFKDLYLSGGVYLGGTGAANKLEDYETGTWTPAFGSAGGATGTTLIQGAYYRKVGNLVVATCDITLTSKGTLNGGDLALVHGLPFTAISASGVGGGSVDLFLDLNQNVNTISLTSQGDTSILFRVTTSEASSASNASWTNLFKNSTRMFLTITYLAS